MASLQSGAAAEAATAKANDGATLVMALNKETKSIVVATIGTDPLTANLSAHFYHTPAFM
ncbi:hypothetical protein Csa_007435 [Cucumis sativus]|uniref:Uncharacterized protein n=1 Tax=Cucumis sativus TaxID=3659 RepID=A0A0A0M1C7_CUCSA|nr:hypothetical protein Csa_007435 [Cucumis sativus]